MYIQAKVKGDSMRPLFNTDSLVQFAFCPIDLLRRGDVVVFKEGQSLVCHRFFSKVRLNESLFLKVKGDAALSFDPLVDSGCFLGKVVYLRKFGISLRLDNLPARMLGLFFSRVAYYYLRLFDKLILR